MTSSFYFWTFSMSICIVLGLVFVLEIAIADYTDAFDMENELVQDTYYFGSIHDELFSYSGTFQVNAYLSDRLNPRNPFFD